MLENLNKFLVRNKRERNFPPKYKRFLLLLKHIFKNLPCLLPVEYNKRYNAFSYAFQAERPLAVLLFEKLKGMVVVLMDRFARSDILMKNSSAIKLMNLDLKEEENLLALEVGFGTNAVLRKLKTTEKSLEREFCPSVRTFHDSSY